MLFAFATEIVLTDTLKTSRKNYYAVWNDLFDGKINSDIIISGASRAKININPKIIEDSTGLNTYNLGINGYNFDMDYLRIKVLMKHNKHPKLMILSLDNVMFGKRKTLFMLEQFLPYTSENDIYTTTKTYKGFNNYDYKLPFVRYIGKTRIIRHSINILFNPSSNISLRYKGYAPQNIDWKDKWNTDLFNNKKYPLPVDTIYISLFDKFLKETKSEGIKIVFVYSPEYFKGQKIYTNRADILALLHRFANKYDIPFLDYSNDKISYTKNYFYNFPHLNSKGADIFTRKLVSDLKKVPQLKSIFH